MGACWNAIAHRITDKLVGFTLISGGGTLIGLAMIPFVRVPAADAWPYLIASAAIHLAYYVLLMRSFRLGVTGVGVPVPSCRCRLCSCVGVLVCTMTVCLAKWRRSLRSYAAALRT